MARRVSRCERQDGVDRGAKQKSPPRYHTVPPSEEALPGGGFFLGPLLGARPPGSPEPGPAPPVGGDRPGGRAELRADARRSIQALPGFLGRAPRPSPVGDPSRWEAARTRAWP